MTTCSMSPDIASAAQLLLGCIIGLIILGIVMTANDAKQPWDDYR